MWHRHIFFLTLLGILVTPSTGWSAKAYITDSFRISLRRGPSIENKILRFVSSGLPVQIRETTPDGWCRVLFEDDEKEVLEGWVLSRYLVKRLPWEDQAKALKEENVRLREKLAQIDDTWTASIEKEKEEMKSLRESHEKTKDELARLSEENDILKSSKRKKWFTTGGLVMFSGLLVGLLVGKPQRTRRLSF